MFVVVILYFVFLGALLVCALCDRQVYKRERKREGKVEVKREDSDNTRPGKHASTHALPPQNKHVHKRLQVKVEINFKFKAPTIILFIAEKQQLTP